MVLLLLPLNGPGLLPTSAAPANLFWVLPSSVPSSFYSNNLQTFTNYYLFLFSSNISSGLILM
uniref:Uncharacterized protein n=1 Tax=Meloidogyne enterolobii TaxID=390850 RepID=A0A6V7U7Z8_MELEN|nr:unnamed protein product [Meloidogyne enterolobii]